ncbi:MAG TPA: hypothetical protein VK537_07620 [Galbitalea sp.]|nr:hypothetical protein [Galbitalea sp.]
MNAPGWWRVEPDPDGDGWLVTNGRKRQRFAPGKDLEAQQHADRLNLRKADLEMPDA